MKIIESQIPASPVRLALTLTEAGVAHQPIDAIAIYRLAQLWDPSIVRPTVTYRRRSRRAIPGTGLVHFGRPGIVADPLNAVRGRLRTTGAVSTRTAHGWLCEAGWPVQSATSRSEALHAWGFLKGDSTVVWDRHLRSGVENVLLRSVAVCGPLPVKAVRAIVRRASQPPTYQLTPPSAPLLVGWLSEHPTLAVSNQVLHARKDVSQADVRNWMLPVDQVVSRICANGRCLTGDLVEALTAEGLSESLSSARAYVYSIPYLFPEGRGVLTTAAADALRTDNRRQGTRPKMAGRSGQMASSVSGTNVTLHPEPKDALQ